MYNFVSELYNDNKSSVVAMQGKRNWILKFIFHVKNEKLKNYFQKLHFIEENLITFR